MCNANRSIGLLFLGAWSVYFGPALWAAPATPAGPSSEAKGPVVVTVVDDVIGAPAPAPIPARGDPDPATTGAKVTAGAGGVFTIDVADTDINKVLRMLSGESQKNIIPSKEVRGTVSASLYNVTIKEALDAILKANGFAYREKGNFIYVYTQKELTELEKSERVVVTEVFRVYHTPAANAAAMLKPFLGPEAQITVSAAPKAGIESSQTSAGGQDHASDDMLVIRDFQDNLDRVRKAIKEIDRRPQQILIEAVICRAALTDDNALGIDFTVLGGVDFNSLAGSKNTINDALTGNILNSSAAGTINDRGFAGAGTAFNTGTKGVPAGGLRVGLVHNNVAAFIAALEEVTATQVLANPKILALNRQKGEVIVGKKTGYLTTTVTDTTAVQTVEFLETGTRLIFRPFIAADGYVRMEVHPEDSDGGLVNNLPVKTTTEITTNVMVRDGHTIVIGGLFRESSDTGRGQVPGLGNLPIAGPLFRKQADSTSREEIIILLTPHIVKDDKGYSDASEAAMKEAEKLRVGVRQGMMCFGRERLAEAAYDKALEELAKPNADAQKALWHLDCATNLNPLFLEAINLKQRLSGKQLSTVDNSSVRYFVRQQILAEKAAPTPATRPVSSAETGHAIIAAATIRPATQPATAPAHVEAPTTQPLALAPATQPATQPVADASEEWDEEWCPGCDDGWDDPMEDDAQGIAAAPATQPATRPAAAEAQVKPLLEEASDVAELPAKPTTRPSDEPAVTELPMDDIDGSEEDDE